jgi:hypothetical protein
VIEPEAVIDPEAVPPAPRPRRHRRAVVAGVTLLAVVAGGIAVATGGGPESKPLALLAGNGAGGAETMAARSGSPAPIAAGQAAAADSSRAALHPFGGSALKFEIEGPLPELPDHAAAWKVTGPNLDRAAVARFAEALDVTGSPVQRDGGWFVEDGDWTLSAYGGDAMGKGGAWYLNLYRNRYDGRPNGGVEAADSPAVPAISRAEAEIRVRALLDRMGAPRASWKVETTDTEIGVGWACAAPSPALSPEELRKLEAEKLRQIEQQNPAAVRAPGAGASGNAGAAAGMVPADKPAPDGGVASCPPPPAPVRGFNVALYPALDGRRADWPVWNVTMRSDGQIENLYGSWVTFERGGDYKLRGVDAALKDLQSPPVTYATDTGTAIEPAPAVAAGSVEGSGSAGSAPSRTRLKGEVASSPAGDRPTDAPVCPPVPMPMPTEEDKGTPSMARLQPAQDDRATSSMMAGCVPPAAQVVRITGVELGLIQTSIFENGQVRMALVPSYRFVGHLDNGSPWETSVIALHQNAIAPPPPDVPVSGDVRSGGGATGVGKAVPPMPTPEPAIAPDPDSPR